MKRYRRIIATSLAAALLLSMAACGAGSSGSQSSAPPETAVSSQPAEQPAEAPATEGNDEKFITMLGFLDPGGESPREAGAGELLKKFTEKTGYTLKTEIVGWEQIEQKLLVAVQSNQAPDVTFVRGASLAKEVSANALLPLDDYIARDYTQEDIDDFLLWDQVGMYKGSKYSLPMSLICYALYVRTDLYEAAGITEYPKTWEEFLDVGQKLNSNAASGFLFWGSAAQPCGVDLMQSMVEIHGGKLIDEEERGTFDSPEAIQAFELIKRMVFDAQIVPQNVTGLKFDETSDMFTAGRAAMYYDGSHRYSKYAAGVGDENLSYIRWPGVTADKPSPCFVSYWSLGIPVNAKNPDIAWEYIKNFAESENQTTYAKVSGEVPVRVSAMDDSFFTDDPNGQRIKWFVDYVAENGTIANTPVQNSKLDESLSLAVQEIISDPNSDVAAIVKKYCAEYNNALS